MRKDSRWRRILAWVYERVGAPKFLFYALLVHIVFFALLVVSLDWTPAPRPAPVKANVVDAVVVDESKVQAEMERLRQAEARKQRQARKLKQARQKEERRLANLKKKRRQEQRRLHDQEKKRRAETKRVAALKKKRQAEQRRLAAERKKRRETQRLAEKEREEQARRAALKKEQAELERRRRQAAERELQQKLAAEQRQVAQAREAKIRSLVDQAVMVIKQKVTRNWLRPPNSKKGLSCQVLVQLIPGGEVVNVRIIASSGDPIFDRSVESAVRKASPLPLPPDRALFDRFRELKFIFKPEG